MDLVFKGGIVSGEMGSVVDKFRSFYSKLVNS